jgi:hypothetical protein
MRRDYATALAALIGVSACDPVNSIGARVRLGPSASDSCVLTSLRQSFGRAPFEGVSLSSDAHDAIRAPITVPLIVHDSIGRQSWAANSKLSIEPQKDSALLLELTTVWWAGLKVPEVEQRRFVAAAASTLDQVRAACAPASSAKIECVAGGLGHHPACDPGS